MVSVHLCVRQDGSRRQLDHVVAVRPAVRDSTRSRAGRLLPRAPGGQRPTGPELELGTVSECRGGIRCV